MTLEVIIGVISILITVLIFFYNEYQQRMVILLSLIPVSFLIFEAAEVMRFILILAFVGLGIFLYRKPILFIISSHKKKYVDLIHNGLNQNEEEVERCARELSTRICELAEEGIVAIRSRDIEGATEIIENLACIINHIKRNRLTYYLRSVVTLTLYVLFMCTSLLKCQASLWQL